MSGSSFSKISDNVKLQDLTDSDVRVLASDAPEFFNSIDDKDSEDLKVDSLSDLNFKIYNSNNQMLRNFLKKEINEFFTSRSLLYVQMQVLSLL